MVRISFEGFELAFKCFESLSSGFNINSNALNPFRMVRICSRMLHIPFEWFEFAFKCFISLSNGSNLNSNASNPVRLVRICI